MQRIHFAPEDLSRVSVMITIGPVAETVFALDLLHRSSGVGYAGWRQQLPGRLGRQLAALTTLTRSLRPIPDLLWLLERPTAADDVRLRAAGVTRQQVAGAVQEFCRLGVLPYWSRVRGYLEAERDARGRILATGGLEKLFSTLHPRAQWKAPVLELPLETSRDIRLDGRGLVIMPSLFLTTKSCVLIDSDPAGGRPVLVYAAPPDRVAAAGLWDQADGGEHALAALLGRTRASVLEALTDSCTTGELAERLGISSAGASQHTAILREAGLITTLRNRNTVLHTVTSLGIALLGKRMRDSNFSNFSSGGLMAAATGKRDSLAG